MQKEGKSIQVFGERDLYPTLSIPAHSNEGQLLSGHYLCGHEDFNGLPGEYLP
jgi:hypothetical protein